LCAIDEHKDHDTISAKAERNERHKDLSGNQKAMQERIQNIKDDMKVLQQVTVSTNQSPDKAIENADQIFDQLIHCIERRRSKVKEEIRTKERNEVRRVVDLQNNLEDKLTEMKRSIADLNTLTQTENHIHFLQNYPQNLSLSEYTGLNRVPAVSHAQQLILNGPIKRICTYSQFKPIYLTHTSTRPASTCLVLLCIVCNLQSTDSIA